MELAAKDEVAYQVCRARKEKVVSLIHQHLGLASVAEVSDIPGKGLFKLETFAGSILVNHDLTKVLLD